MASFAPLITSLLKKYKHPDVTKTDVLTALTAFGDLRPKFEDFVFNDGSTRQLVQLDGTIPVTYKGNVYNIPICIYLMDQHPYTPPIVCVKPTSTMEIKSGRHVDQNGKIDLPYLREWKYDGQQFTLTIKQSCQGRDKRVTSKVHHCLQHFGYIN
ncbi:hypothetical protein DPMN_135660 [Dreissena polymorpha]|uniref:UEV domain-containing protein n=1 Tax=Dreissena polymorpha TaxID=45954 RepID=A0A9D4FYJ3_DREPO|nr:hypothetical protein DPMN_135660 [Dreissena polymorpha]